MSNNDYFLDRIVSKVGVTDENRLFKFNTRMGLVAQPFIYPDKEGNICIVPFKLNGETYTYTQRRFSNLEVFENTKTWTYTRYSLHNEKRLNRKSNVPQGQTPPPFLSPNIIDAENITTLNITEGYIKAIQLYTSGLYSVGFSGISIYRESDTKAMFSDVRDVIKSKNVKVVNVVYDADCNEFSKKHLENGSDLRQRLQQFYNSFDNISKLISDLDCEICFVSLKDKKLKGIDDLIQDHSECVSELESLDTMDGKYFYKTFKKSEVLKYLLLDGINNFATFFKSQLINNSFFYGRKQYEFEGELLKEIVETNDDLNFFAVGNEYYTFSKVGELMYRKKEMLKDAGYTKEDFIRATKYDDFCNVACEPNFYRQIVNNKYNLYAKHEMEVKTNHCETIHKLIHHIFDEQVELGYDYLYQLYFNPNQKLPILCLVSESNQTGKNTFGETFMEAMFGENACMITNTEINEKWNESYVTKSVVAMNEILIENKSTYEKIKTLATDKKTPLQRKGLKSLQINIFMRIIMMSNNEDSFIRLNKFDRRFWVRKIGLVKEKNKDFNANIFKEVGYFVEWLKNRGCNYETKGDRMFFEFEDIVTDALLSTIEESKSWLYKDLKQDIVDLFLNRSDLTEIRLTPKLIKENFYYHNSRVEKSFITKVLKNEFSMTPEKVQRFYPINKDGVISVSETNGTPYCFKRADFVDDSKLDNTTPTEEETPF